MYMDHISYLVPLYKYFGGSGRAVSTHIYPYTICLDRYLLYRQLAQRFSFVFTMTMKTPMAIRLMMVRKR